MWYLCVICHAIDFNSPQKLEYFDWNNAILYTSCTVHCKPNIVKWLMIFRISRLYFVENERCDVLIEMWRERTLFEYRKTCNRFLVLKGIVKCIFKCHLLTFENFSIKIDDVHECHSAGDSQRIHCKQVVFDDEIVLCISIWMVRNRVNFNALKCVIIILLIVSVVVVLVARLHCQWQ